MNALSDLIRAVQKLAPDPDSREDSATRAAIAALLGIPPSMPVLPGRAQQGGGSGPATAGPGKDPGPLTAQQPARVDPRPAQAGRAAFEVVAVSGKRSTPAPRYEPIQSSIDPTLVPLPLAPLFAPNCVRALLSAVVARPDPDAPVDVPAVVDRIARLEPITFLPRHRAPTLAHGVQVLLDTGPGLAPFTRDAREMITAIRLVAGCERTDVRLFRGAPSLVSPECAPTRREPYRVPSQGVAVLGITDLGIAPVLGTPLDVVGAWLDVDSRLRAQGSQLVLLVPYPPGRWPSRASRLTIVAWDRSTTVSMVKRSLRGGR